MTNLKRRFREDGAVYLPKALSENVLALAEPSVGQDMRASQFASSIMKQGEGVLAVHADRNWISAPFPERNCILTFVCPRGND